MPSAMIAAGVEATAFQRGQRPPVSREEEEGAACSRRVKALTSRRSCSIPAPYLRETAYWQGHGAPEMLTMPVTKGMLQDAMEGTGRQDDEIAAAAHSTDRHGGQAGRRSSQHRL